MSHHFISTEFDELDIPVGEKITRPKAVPHCDCSAANEAYFGEKLRTARSDDDQSFAMVPVTTVNGHCPHCGYTCLMQPLQDLTFVIKNRETNKRTYEKRFASKQFAVRGHNEATGEEIEFPNAKAAYEAGYGSVQSALTRRQGRLREWHWEYVVPRDVKATG